MFILEGNVTELENNSKDLYLMIDKDNVYVVLEHETTGLLLHRLMHN